jgi:hypothetical protein
VNDLNNIKAALAAFMLSLTWPVSIIQQLGYLQAF